MMQSSNKQKSYRKSIRLSDYDYSRPGLYFVTICCQNRKFIFGRIADGEMILNAFGNIAHECVAKISGHFPTAEIDRFVIMPNHVHLLIFIRSEDTFHNIRAIRELPLRERMESRRKMLLPKIIGYYKMNVTKRVNTLRQRSGSTIWQRNYYEHVVRNDDERNRLRRYIFNNPPCWEYDRENRNDIPISEKKIFWDKFLAEE